MRDRRTRVYPLASQPANGGVTSSQNTAVAQIETMMNAADTFVLTSQARGAVFRELERQCGNMEGDR